MDALKKAAIRAYKEQKTRRGIFAVRCRATGSVWVDAAMDLAAAENRTWFVLRSGGDPFTEKTILEEFAAHGRGAFSFEILETLDEDVPSVSLRDLLKERKRQWMERLDARTLSPV